MNIISASYGNDSVAMLRWAYERSLPDVAVVYCDTGWAAETWPARVQAGERLARGYGFTTHRVQSIGFAELVRIKSGFPANGLQFCTAHLKGLPFLQWADEADPKAEAIVLIGKRRAESAARAAIPEFVAASDYHGGRQVWHPLFAHSTKERDALLSRAGFAPLPHRSLECNPCVNANRGDFRRLTLVEINKVAALELEIGRSMFRPERFGATGIVSVVRWAKYSPGQANERQADLLDLGCGSPFGCGT